MTSGKSSVKTRQWCLSLLTSLVGACGSDTPAFQEKAMSAFFDPNAQASVDQLSADNSADATAGSSEQKTSDFRTIEAASAAEDSATQDGSQDPQLVVDVKESQLRFGSQSTDVKTLADGATTDDVTYTLEAPAGKDPGKIINGKTYVSPAAGTEAYDVTIKATSKSDPTLVSKAIVKLVPAAQVFVGCTNDAKGFPIKANIFQIPENTNALPNFSGIAQKTATACMDSFQVANRAWSDGFPGHPELIEWFAVQASSRITVPTAGTYRFKLNADDGAKLYIDDNLVIDNDGLHAQIAVNGSITLSAGDHELVMEYFQGPRYHIALELFWRTPGSSTYVYVPASAYKP